MTERQWKNALRRVKLLAESNPEEAGRLYENLVSELGNDLQSNLLWKFLLDNLDLGPADGDENDPDDRPGMESESHDNC